jgi:hypothetical protein
VKWPSGEEACKNFLNMIPPLLLVRWLDNTNTVRWN